MTIKGRPDLVMLSIESADGRGDPDSNLMCEVAFAHELRNEVVEELVF